MLNEKKFINPKKEGEKYSSLHDDLLSPKGSANWKLETPEELTMNGVEIEQFGVSISDIEQKYGKKVTELSWDEYSEIVQEAVKRYYDVVVVSVFDQYFGYEENELPNIDRFGKMTELISEYETMDSRFGINLIKTKGDFKSDSNLVLSLEAGAHLIKKMEDIQKLIDSNIKIFGLQYGEDNIIAEKTGLTDFGKKATKMLLDRGLMIDLAHTTKSTRKNLMDIAEDEGRGDLILYTHGSTIEDLDPKWRDFLGDRALSQDETKRIIKMGGIIGLGISRPFFDNTKKLAERIDSILQSENAIDQIAIGSDFGGLPPEVLNDIKTPADFKKIADLLSENYGISDDHIKKILRTNAKTWISKRV